MNYQPKKCQKENLKIKILFVLTVTLIQIFKLGKEQREIQFFFWIFWCAKKKQFSTGRNFFVNYIWSWIKHYNLSIFQKYFGFWCSVFFFFLVCKDKYAWKREEKIIGNKKQFFEIKILLKNIPVLSCSCMRGIFVLFPPLRRHVPRARNNKCSESAMLSSLWSSLSLGRAGLWIRLFLDFFFFWKTKFYKSTKMMMREPVQSTTYHRRISAKTCCRPTFNDFSNCRAEVQQNSTRTRPILPNQGPFFPHNPSLEMELERLFANFKIAKTDEKGILLVL